MTATNSQSNQRLNAIAIVVIIALLGINGYLWYSKINQDKLIDKHSSELIETEKGLAKLEKTYYESLSELEEMRTANGELNAIIDAQKEDLKAQRDRISTLIISEKDLEEAEVELNKLRNMRDRYVAQISRLKEENAQLTMSNEILSQEKEILTGEVQKERVANEELTSEAAMLKNQNVSIATERDALSKTVVKASVIQVDDIVVNGYRIKNSGKESLTKRATKAEGLKICFEAQQNTVTEAGVERFYVRVVNPLGETMSLDDMGSGIIEDADERQVRYTQYREMDYANVPSDVCISWQPGISFGPGLYLIEVYNKGYLAGSATFTLK
jgi:chromosome segregation ATPase